MFISQFNIFCLILVWNSFSDWADWQNWVSDKIRQNLFLQITTCTNTTRLSPLKKSCITNSQTKPTLRLHRASPPLLQCLTCGTLYQRVNPLLLASVYNALHAHSSRQQEAETRSSSIYMPPSQRTQCPSAPSSHSVPWGNWSAALKPCTSPTHTPRTSPNAESTLRLCWHINLQLVAVEHFIRNDTHVKICFMQRVAPTTGDAQQPFRTRAFTTQQHEAEREGTTFTLNSPKQPAESATCVSMNNLSCLTPLDNH